MWCVTTVVRGHSLRAVSAHERAHTGTNNPRRMAEWLFSVYTRKGAAAAMSHAATTGGGGTRPPLRVGCCIEATSLASAGGTTGAWALQEGGGAGC